MNIKELEKKLEAIESTNLDDGVVKEFGQLLSFVDNAIGESSKKDLAEKSQVLMNTVLSIRDYIQRSLVQDAYRKFLLTEVTNAINAELPEPEVEEEEPPSFQKKILSPETE